MKTKKINRDEIRENSITLLMSKDEKHAVQKAADEIGVSMSTFVRMILKKAIKKGE